jgi:3',5'-cyclic AMP phosphodiesterase CpdA
MTAGAGVTLAHLSDLHLPVMDRYAPQYWTIKRTLGYLNWHRGRKNRFLMNTVDQLLADLSLRNPDHIAVTGDLVNLGLPSELEAAQKWLQAVGSADEVSVIPGNHDIYVPRGSDQGVGRWQSYMASDEFGRQIDKELGWSGEDRVVEKRFPYIRRVAGVALIGLNSAVPTPPFIAAGELGDWQLARLASILERLRALSLQRVILIHHPPLVGQAPARRALRDAAKLEAVIAQHGAELILHGHNHRNSLAWAKGPGGHQIPVVGIAAGGMSRDAYGAANLGRYNLIRFVPDGSGCRMDITGRGFAQAGGSVVELDRRSFSLEGELTDVVSPV